LLRPDGTTIARTLEARDGRLDIAMPDGAWDVAGIVIGATESPRKTKSAATRENMRPPVIAHTPATVAVPGKPLELRIRATPANSVASIRLHYRAVNQLAAFNTLERAGADASFTIPAENVPSKWDLMYYFEILSKDGGGWFAPDPHTATPYYVVKTNETIPANTATAKSTP